MSLASLLREKSQDNILSFSDALVLAQQCNVELLEIEQAALEIDIWPERYQRHRGIFSSVQQHRLLGSTVAVIGCGGLGGQVFEEFIRLGIGRIIVVDPDIFTTHNLNRQLLCTHDELGNFKVQAAFRRARCVNPAVHVIPFVKSFSPDIHREVSQADVVIDCLDSVADRHELAKFCRTAKLSLVHGAVVKWFGQVGVQKESNLIHDLYPQIPANDKITKPSVLCCSVSAVASLQVVETVKLLLGLDSSLNDNWRSIDLLTCEIEEIG